MTTMSMSAEEYRVALATLGLSQARLGRLLSLDKATPNRWAMGSVPVPQAVVLLLLILLAGNITMDQLEAIKAPPAKPAKAKARKRAKATEGAT